MDQDRHEYYANPNEHIDRIRPRSANCQQYGHQPEQRMDPYRKAEQSKVQIGLRRGWFAKKHGGVAS
jgi:hypothetical protein